MTLGGDWPAVGRRFVVSTRVHGIGVSRADEFWVSLFGEVGPDRFPQSWIVGEFAKFM
jgi:hypothetical protein